MSRCDRSLTGWCTREPDALPGGRVRARPVPGRHGLGGRRRRLRGGRHLVRRRIVERGDDARGRGPPAVDRPDRPRRRTGLRQRARRRGRHADRRRRRARRPQRAPGQPPPRPGRHHRSVRRALRPGGARRHQGGAGVPPDHVGRHAGRRRGGRDGCGPAQQRDPRRHVAPLPGRLVARRSRGARPGPVPLPAAGRRTGPAARHELDRAPRRGPLGPSPARRGCAAAP